MIRRTKVVLGLYRLTIPQKIEKGRLIVTSMTGNAHFPAPIPGLAALTLAINALELAAIAAASGGTDATAVMYEKETYLDGMLTNEGLYVEIIANDTPAESDSIILSAGMTPKKVTVRKAREFHAVHGEIPGQVKLSTKYFRNAAFVWQYKVTTAAAWVSAPQTNKASTVISGLSSAVRYSFRVAVLKSNVLSGWSDVVELIVL